MNSIDLTIQRDDYERTLAQLQRDIDRAARAGDRDTVDIIRDTYTVYQRKLDAVNKQLTAGA